MEGKSDLETPVQWSDPRVIGVGALFLGFALGSGRLKWLQTELTRVGVSVGTLVLHQFSRSLQEHNPQLFNFKAKKFKVS